MPCCACLWVYDAVDHACLDNSQPGVILQYLFAVESVQLFEISFLQTISLMLLSRAHPATTLLAVVVFLALFFLMLKQHRLDPIAMTLLPCYALALMILPNVLDDILLVRSVWTAVARSQANAASVANFRSERSVSDVELATREPARLPSAEWPPVESLPTRGPCLESLHMHVMQTVSEEDTESDARNISEPTAPQEGGASQPIPEALTL